MAEITWRKAIEIVKPRVEINRATSHFLRQLIFYF